MVVAQRQRERLRQQQALLVARAHEEERAWVAGELHDDVLQRIALVRAELESLWGAPSVPDATAVTSRLHGVNTELVDLAVAVRAIATRMHPTVVDQVGLLPALQSLKAEFERGSNLAVTLDIRGSEHTPHARRIASCRRGFATSCGMRKRALRRSPWS
jgi:signal transduction histidine kinase